jgi:hypothetical protein
VSDTLAFIRERQAADRWRDWMGHPCTAAVLDLIAVRHLEVRDGMADSVDVRDAVAMSAARAEHKALAWIIDSITELAEQTPKEQ